MSESSYAGRELELFAEAHTWKRYLAREITPFLGARVLEVGAGVGTTTKALIGERQTAWTALEPDATLAGELAGCVARGELPRACRVTRGTITDVPASEAWDTILYVDVLEHILDDRQELREATARLEVGGHLVVMSPAHAWLYSPFDASIGHHRRYTRGSLLRAAPRDLEVVRASYLDSCGLLASLANRVALRRALPSRQDILLWDRVLVRASSFVDERLGYNFGKSVLAVWRRRS